MTYVGGAAARHQRRQGQAGRDGRPARIVEQAGYTQVRTLLNSGNVVFEGPKATRPKIAARLEAAIEKGVGFHSRVVVVDGSVMDTVVREQT